MVSPAPSPTRPASSGSLATAPSFPLPPARPAAGGTVAGRFRLDARTSSWWWSPEMHHLLGLAPGSARPSLETLLQCQHRDDRARTLSALDHALATGRPVAVEARVLRRDGPVRVVVLLGEPRCDDGVVTAVDGMCLDITGGRLAHDDLVTALQTEVGQLRTAMISRAAIEQAKGILMLLTSCSEQPAFELLAHISSHTHRKVREVAQAIVDSAAGRAGLPDDVRAILRDACPPAPRLG